MDLPATVVERIVSEALAEDLGWGDLTTEALVPPDLMGEAELTTKATGIIAGLSVATLAFQTVDQYVTVDPILRDGARVQPGEVAGFVRGPVASILTAERVALNFLQRLSGIATQTALYVEAVAGLPVRIVDTRKTTPSLRILEKYAVRVGGGQNHRYNLSDGILIKDNHLEAARKQGTGIGEAIWKARRTAPHTLKIEVEVVGLDGVAEALKAGADIILLDNMSPETMRQAVLMVGGQAILEASGGITLENVRAVAEAGVDLISIGALTHSVKALDISLELKG